MWLKSTQQSIGLFPFCIVKFILSVTWSAHLVLLRLELVFLFLLRLLVRTVCCVQIGFSNALPISTSFRTHSSSLLNCHLHRTSDSFQIATVIVPSQRPNLIHSPWSSFDLNPNPFSFLLGPFEIDSNFSSFFSAFIVHFFGPPLNLIVINYSPLISIIRAGSWPKFGMI